MQPKDEKIYSTRDIGLAATLLASGFPMLGVDVQIEGGARGNVVGYFSFPNSAELKAFEQDFWKGECKVEPKSFLQALRSAKSQVTNIQKNPQYNR